MKSALASAAFLCLYSFSAFADDANYPSISYKCQPEVSSVNLDAGPASGMITQVISFDIPAVSDPSQVKFYFKVQGLTSTDEMNGSTKPRSFVETFTTKDIKSETMIELLGDQGNVFVFDAIFLEFAPPGS